MPLAGNPATDSTPGPQKRAGDQKSNGDHVRLYYHMDYLGTANYLTARSAARWRPGPTTTSGG